MRALWIASARANDGLGVVRDGGVVGVGLGRCGERGTICGFVGFVVEDDTCEIVFSLFAVIWDGEEEGIKRFFKAYQVIVSRLTVDGSKMILRFTEVGQDVFWGHVGNVVKGAGVEPDDDEAKLVY